MSRLLDLANSHQSAMDDVATGAAARVARLWSGADVQNLEAEWDARAPQIAAVVTSAQVQASQHASPFVTAAVGGSSAAIVTEAFAGVTREGREVAPELYSGVTHTKRLIGAGAGIGTAFQAGTALMALLASNTIRDAGRSAGNTLAVANGRLFSVRVISPGACSRCAILAGVRGYRTDFERHPECRCFSMPLREDESPDGFFASPADYFNSLSEAEQDRVFTKSGAWAIRNGADPTNVVNARRGAYKTSTRRPDGSYSRSRLRPITIGRNANGDPIQVYATLEGTTSRGGWGRIQDDLMKVGDERYRRSRTLRLMPEQILKMTEGDSPERIRELLQRYGYIR